MDHENHWIDDRRPSIPSALKRDSFKGKSLRAAFVLMLVVLPHLGLALNGGPYYTIDAQMLVCPDRLIVFPTITTSGSDQIYTRTFTAFIADGNANSSPPSAVPSRDFYKWNSVFDAWFYEDPYDFVPFISTTWSGDPYLQIFSEGVKDFSAEIPAPITVSFAGGTGTIVDPYLVSTADQLQSIACQDESQLRYYALTNDIDLAGRNFIPIGLSDMRFRGGIDGRGFTIANLTMNHPGASRIGFIGAADEFYLRDIRFTNAQVHGTKDVGIALGDLLTSSSSFMSNVVIEGGVVRGVEHLGGLVGSAEEFSASQTHVEADVIVSTPRYHGPSASISFDDVNLYSTRTGGVIGDGAEGISIIGGTFDVSITQDAHVADIGVPVALAGLIGRPNWEVLITGVTADIVIDLTVDGLPSGSESGGGVVGNEFDDGSAFTDSTVTLDVRFEVAPAVDNEEKVFAAFGGIAGEVEETFFANLDVRGSILIDTRAITSGTPVRVVNIGGALGDAGSSTMTTLQNSHIDVDVTILGTNADTSEIGGLFGDVHSAIVSDVRVDGAVYVEGAANGVGGLVGYFDNAPSDVRANFQSVIYRGEGVTVGAGSTNVGVLWGDVRGYTPGAGNVYTGANVHWDSNRNGVGSAVAGELGLPASSAQLGNLAWLTTTAAFDPTVWCVISEAGMSLPAVIAVTPACQGGGTFEPTEPSAPSALSATPGNARVTLQWNPPASDGGREADVYTIHVRAVGASSWSSVHPHGRCTPDTLTCGVVTNLTNGQAYDFRVAAENEIGRGPWSSTVRATPGTIPAAPASVAAAADDGAVTLTWVAPADDGGYPVTAYLVEMTTGVGGVWMPVTPTACDAPTCAVVSGLTNGVTVGFRIAAVNALGASVWSSVVTAQPTRNPAAPSNLAATPGDGIVTLTWNAPADTGGLAVTYGVDISMNGGVTFAAATITPCAPVSATCAVVANLTNGVTYAFRVTASTTAGVSPAAGPVLATPQAPADVPVITRTIPGANRGWFIIAPATAATVGHEISLDDGASWQAVEPHVGDRVIRITGLTNGTTYRVRLRSVRSDGTKSEPAHTVLMPTGIRIAAPDLTVALDPDSVAVTNDGDVQRVAIDILVTNAGGIPLADVWLRWPTLPAGTTLVDFDASGSDGTWVTLDDWWYGENVDLAPGATHRVRVTLETQP